MTYTQERRKKKQKKKKINPFRKAAIVAGVVEKSPVNKSLTLVILFTCYATDHVRKQAIHHRPYYGPQQAYSQIACRRASLPKKKTHPQPSSLPLPQNDSNKTDRPHTHEGKRIPFIGLLSYAAY